MKLILKLFILFTITNSFGQVAGTSIYQFLNLSTSARQIALGGEVLTILDDVNQPIWNPATINNDLDRQVSVNYTSYLAGINIGSISYATSFSNRLGVLHANIKFVDYGSIVSANDNGDETGTFRPNDVAVSVGYAVTIPKSDLHFGANLKFVNSSISSFTSSGLAVDIGLLYANDRKPYTFTLVARNIGTQLRTYNGVNETLPLRIAFGASYQLAHVPIKWYGTIDNLQEWNLSVPNPSNKTVDLNGDVTQEKIGFANNLLRHFIVGAELFSEKAINVRLGYNFRRSQELSLQNVRTFSGLSYGFGIRMKKIKLNYAYSKYHSASNTSTFSLLINLDE